MMVEVMAPLHRVRERKPPWLDAHGHDCPGRWGAPNLTVSSPMTRC